MKAIVHARDRLRTLPLPRFLNAIETARDLLFAFLVFYVPAITIGIAIDIHKGVGSPVPFGSLVELIFIGAVAGLSEELLFRYFPKRYIGNGGLVIGTLLWIVLHQFYAPVKTIYRLPADALFGIFYLKLWRGRLWWLAFVIHPLWNILIVSIWQVIKICIA